MKDILVISHASIYYSPTIFGLRRYKNIIIVICKSVIFS